MGQFGNRGLVVGYPRCRVGGVLDGVAACCSARGHLGQRHWSTIWICHHEEPSPGGLLSRPEDGDARSPRLVLPGVRVLHLEANGSRSGLGARRKDASLVMPTVVAVKNDPPCGSPYNDDDVILKTHWESERTSVERLSLAEISNEQDQTVVVVNLHAHKVIDGDAAPTPGTLPGRWAYRPGGLAARELPLTGTSRTAAGADQFFLPAARSDLPTLLASFT